MVGASGSSQRPAKVQPFKWSFLRAPSFARALHDHLVYPVRYRSEPDIPARLHGRGVPISAVSMCSDVRIRKLDLLDNFVSACEQSWRDRKSKRLGDLDVNNQLGLSRLLDGEVGGLGPLQDLVHEGGKPPVEEDDARPVRHRPPASGNSR